MNLLPNSSIPTATFSLIRDHVLLRSPFFCLCVYRIYTTCLQEWIKSKIHRLLQSTVYMHAVCLTLKKDATCFSETSKRCQKTEKKLSAVKFCSHNFCDKIMWLCFWVVLLWTDTSNNILRWRSTPSFH